MSNIENGIKQPLRWYDDVGKQNWRQKHVHGGGLKNENGVCMTAICPTNQIIPWQVRRRRSAAVITSLDLYRLDDATGEFVYHMNVLSEIPAPQTSCLNIIQLQTADNIVWNPTKDINTSLINGYYYLYLSDSYNEWWSEVFYVDCELTDNVQKPISIFGDAAVTGSEILSKDGTDNGAILFSYKPF